ncbi:MAG: superoxide dismutase family protein [bacterium]
MYRFLFRTALLVSFLAVAACGGQQGEETVLNLPTGPDRAVAVLHAPDGSPRGTVTFTDTEEGVRVVADVRGLEPGAHGFHLHEYGDCTASDFTSAGGHFNPTGAPHGGPDDPQHHAGDFGNIMVGEEGTGHAKLVSQMISLDPGPASILGRAVIIHEGEDDLESQPTGSAGGRAACGVVGRAPAPEEM